MSAKKETDFENRLYALIFDMLRELHPALVLHQISEKSSLQEDLGIDSLARAELMIRIEEAFHVHLTDESVMSAEVVGDLLLAIRSAQIIEQVAVRRVPGSHTSQKSQIFGDRAETAPGSHPVLEPGHALTLVEVLEWRARQDSRRVWARFHSDDDRVEELSYGDLLERSRKVAAALGSLDLPANPVVALMLPTSLEFFYCFYGIQMAGGIPVPLYPPDRPTRIEEHMRRQIGILSNCRAALMIAAPELRSLGGVLKRLLPDLRRWVHPDELMKGPVNDEKVHVSAESLAFLQYTSGSTGNPKGVALTHSNILANIRAIGEVIRPNDNDVFVSWLPLYHDMGLIGASIGTLYYGVPLVLMSPLRFIARPERWLWTIHEQRGTLSAAPNFAYELCARKVQDSQIGGLDLSAWRGAFNGAEPVSASTLERFAERFKAFGFRTQALTPLYGLAESTVGLTFPPMGRGPKIDRVERERFLIDNKAVPSLENRNALSIVGCGMPLPKHEVRVVGASDLELRDREIGRIQFRGPSSTSGYYRNIEATRKLFHGEWLESGDLGYLVEGELFVTGRAKDMIIRAGRHIFPYELEESIGSFPEVRKGGVAVFGRLDPASGAEQIIVLAEVRHPSLATQILRDKIKEQALESFGIPPDDIVLAPPRSVLKTPSGKIRRNDCLRLYEQGALGKSAPAWVQWIRLHRASLIPGAKRLLRRGTDLAYGLYFYAVVGVVFLVCVVAILALPKLPWRISFCRSTVRMIWRLTGTAPQVVGIRNLQNAEQKAGPVIVVANHSSYVDSLLLGSVLPGHFSFVAKKEFQGSFLGTLMRRIGTLFVERFDALAATKDSEEMARAIRQGKSLVVFPEGTFTRAAGLRAFHMGAFLAAMRSGAPIVPITLRGTRSMLRAEWRLPRHAAIWITVGAALEPEGASRPEGSIWKAAIRLRDSAREEILRHCGEPDLGQ